MKVNSVISGIDIKNIRDINLQIYADSVIVPIRLNISEIDLKKIWKGRLKHKVKTLRQICVEK